MYCRTRKRRVSELGPVQRDQDFGQHYDLPEVSHQPLQEGGDSEEQNRHGDEQPGWHQGTEQEQAQHFDLGREARRERGQLLHDSAQQAEQNWGQEGLHVIYMFFFIFPFIMRSL